MIFRHKDCEFTLNVDAGRGVRLRWTQADGRYWRAVWLNRQQAIEAATLLVDAAARLPGNIPPAGPLCCSFCGKSQHQVRKLIAGPAVLICDECVKLCTEMACADDSQKVVGGAQA